MKLLLKLFATMIAIVTLSSSPMAQCEKEIETNPENPINDEFLPLKNDWYPGPTQYTVNSYLNTGMDWYMPSTIDIDLTSAWSSPVGNGTGIIAMENPFSNGHDPTHLNTVPFAPGNDDERDFRWEDGWELLWMNLGKHFNGDPLTQPSAGTYFALGDDGDPINVGIAPSNVPYFVLYNRYRGVVRLFANVWQDNLNQSFQEMSVTMKFDGTDEGELGPFQVSGIFRHASQFLTALDQSSQFTRMIGPRYQYVNSTDWMVAEFQMAFDPCVCMKEFDDLNTPGKIIFEFETVEEVSIDMISRTIEVENEFDDTNLNDDFLNLTGIDLDDYQPGTIMYKRMEDMLEEYQDDLQEYNDFNQGWSDAKWELLETATTLVTTGGTLALPGISQIDDLVEAESIASTIDEDENPNKAVSEAIKGIIGVGVDFASFELFGKKPEEDKKKPTQPVANFSETSFKGTLEKTFYQDTPPLLIPGGIDQYQPSANTYLGYGKMRLTPRIFPAYNKVMGQAALLKTPVPKVFSDYTSNYSYSTWGSAEPNTQCGVDSEGDWDFDFKLRFDSPLEVAMNRTLDFDYEKTNTFANLELTIVVTGSEAETEDYSTIESNSNMHVTHDFNNRNGFREIQYNSKWINLEDLSEYVFAITHGEEFDDGCTGYNASQDQYTVDCSCDLEEETVPNFTIKQIKLKLLHDMYFDQVNSIGEQNNVTQVHSYILYDFNRQINLIGTTESQWSQQSSSGVFDAYHTGVVELGTEVITPSHSYVNEVVGNDLYINAEEVEISGDLDVQNGYNLVIQALDEIRALPDSEINPNVHLRIKPNFYNVPTTYASNSEVYNFCNSSSYQANTLSRAGSDSTDENTNERNNKTKEIENSVVIYPNPTSELINIKSSIVGLSSVSITDLSGRTVIDITGFQPGQTSASIQVNDLKPGVYFVKTNCSGEITTDRLVISR